MLTMHPPHEGVGDALTPGSPGECVVLVPVPAWSNPTS